MADKQPKENNNQENKKVEVQKQSTESQKQKFEATTNLIQLRRVSRRYKGGRRMSFSAFAVAGDQNGKIGAANGKANDVGAAQNKAVEKAKKSMQSVQLKGNTIPHQVEFKFKSTKVLLKPAAPGTGIVAGGTVKSVAQLAGIKDLLSKVQGSTHPINTALATVKALRLLRHKRN